MVGHTARLAATVHRQHRIAHVYAPQWDGGGEDIAQCAAARHIAVVDKTLAGHARLAAYLGEDGCRKGIAGILLRSIELDNRPSAQHGMIGGVVLLGIIGMETMRVVGRNHECALHSLMERLLRAVLHEGYAAQHGGQERTSRALLGLRASLLVVEYGQHLCDIALRSGQHGLQTGKAHRQVIEPSGGNELIVDAKRAGGLRVGKVKVEVEDVFCLHRLLLAQFLHNGIDEQVATFQLIGEQSQYGQHVLLAAQLHAIVHLTVEMDGEIADLQQRTAYVQQAGNGLKRAVAAQYDASCKRQRTVEPRGENRAAIHLGVQTHHAALATHLGIGLHTERWGVAMGTNHVESRIGKRLAAYAEGINGGVVLRDEELVARRNGAKGKTGVYPAEAIGLQFADDVACREEVDGRCVEEIQ